MPLVAVACLWHAVRCSSHVVDTQLTSRACMCRTRCTSHRIRRIVRIWCTSTCHGRTERGAGVYEMPTGFNARDGQTGQSGGWLRPNRGTLFCSALPSCASTRCAVHPCITIAHQRYNPDRLNGYTAVLASGGAAVLGGPTTRAAAVETSAGRRGCAPVHAVSSDVRFAI